MPFASLVVPFLASAALQASPPAAQTQGRAWTFLIYAACDNNAEEDGNFFEFLDGVRGAWADDPAVEIVLFIDRSTKYSTNASSLGEDFADARLYRLRSGASQRLAGGEPFPEVTLEGGFEPDSADPQYVRKLLAFGRARFPAQRTALMLYGHADGRAMCPDEQSGNEMGFAALARAFEKQEQVDLLALELCNMGGIEIGYEWRPGNGGFAAETLLAIPNAGPALDWSRVFARLQKSEPAKVTGQDFARLIVEEGGAGRRAAGQDHEAVAAYDLARAAEAKRALDALAVELARADTKAVFEELRGPGAQGYALNYTRDRLARDPFVDLHDLGRRAAASERLDAATRAASARLVEAVDAYVLASWGGEALRGFEPGASGACITFPPGDAALRGGKRVWANCRWYTPLPAKGVFGQLAWCRDGATAGNGKVENWFELLDRWFDDTQKGPEGLNGYAW